MEHFILIQGNFGGLIFTNTPQTGSPTIDQNTSYPYFDARYQAGTPRILHSREVVAAGQIHILDISPGVQDPTVLQSTPARALSLQLGSLQVLSCLEPKETPQGGACWSSDTGTDVLKSCLSSPHQASGGVQDTDGE